MRRFSPIQLQAAWSVIGTYLFIFGVAYYTDGFREFWECFVLFFQGRIHELALGEKSLVDSIPLAAAYLVIDLPCAVVVAQLVHALPKVQIEGITHSLAPRTLRSRIKMLRSKFEANPDDGRQVFAIFFSVIFLEEVFARALFLGLLYYLVQFIPHETTQVIAFYTLFLLGNGLWALAHLGNYERHYGRSVLWVVPQFLGGFGLTLIYWRYGFWPALIAHFAFDAMIWCVEKRQTFNKSDLLHLAVATCYAGLAFWFLKASPEAFVTRVSHAESYGVPGWDFWELFKLALFIHGSSNALFGILMYDQSGSEKQNSVQQQLNGGCGAIIGAYVWIWIFHGLSGSIPIAILILAIFKTFSSTDTSLNAMCRTFWSTVPFAGVVLVAIESLPFLQALGFLFLVAVSLIPSMAIEDFARQE